MVFIVMVEVVGEGQAAEVDGGTVGEKGEIVAIGIVTVRASQSLGARISRIIADRRMGTRVFSGGIWA